MPSAEARNDRQKSGARAELAGVGAFERDPVTHSRNRVGKSAAAKGIVQQSQRARNPEPDAEGDENSGGGMGYGDQPNRVGPQAEHEGQQHRRQAKHEELGEPRVNDGDSIGGP